MKSKLFTQIARESEAPIPEEGSVNNEEQQQQEQQEAALPEVPQDAVPEDQPEQDPGQPSEDDADIQAADEQEAALVEEDQQIEAADTAQAAQAVNAIKITLENLSELVSTGCQDEQSRRVVDAAVVGIQQDMGAGVAPVAATESIAVWKQASPVALTNLAASARNGTKVAVERMVQTTKRYLQNDARSIKLAREGLDEQAAPVEAEVPAAVAALLEQAMKPEILANMLYSIVLGNEPLPENLPGALPEGLPVEKTQDGYTVDFTSGLGYEKIVGVFSNPPATYQQAVHVQTPSEPIKTEVLAAAKTQAIGGLIRLDNTTRKLYAATQALQERSLKEGDSANDGIYLMLLGLLNTASQRMVPQATRTYKEIIAAADAQQTQA